MSSYRRYITENTLKEALITFVTPVATRYLPEAGTVAHDHSAGKPRVSIRKESFQD